MQIKLAGMHVKDFWTFIEANDILDRLYRLSKMYDKMNAQEQIVFLSEAEKVFSDFERVPNEVWEEEYLKYKQVLDTYKNIRKKIQKNNIKIKELYGINGIVKI